MKIKVGLVDDHQLFLKSLSLMLHTLPDFEVVVEALDGRDLQQKLAAKKDLPDLVLIDVNMPVMNGMETAAWLRKNHPAMRLVALTMNDKEEVVLGMFKAGCCTYLLKDVSPAVLEKALHEVYAKGYYNAGTVVFNPARLVMKTEDKVSVSPKEMLFLKLACSDLTYKQIAAEMGVTERTVDGYRESLFLKFGVQSRVGLCLEAIRKEFVGL